MPRRTPPGRLEDVAHAACRVFIEKGYRRTLLTDVGKDLGLSHAILYRYVDSKEALFELALAYAIDPAAIQAIEVPVPAPARGRTLELIQAWAAERAQFPRLTAATADPADDPAIELAGIIDECYEFVESNWRVLGLIARSAPDMPEIMEFFFIDRRAAYIRELTGYLRQRQRMGQLRQVSDVDVAARFIIESIAWFGWHRRGDPGRDTFSDDRARQTVQELLLAAFVPNPADPPTHVCRELT